MSNWEKLISQGLSALGIPLSQSKVDALGTLLSQLVRWNRVHNLTALKEPEEIVEVEILDSLAPLLFPEIGFKRASTFADVGCGAGFPLLPLVIATEGVVGVGIDSSQKRLAFLSHAARVVGVSNRVRVIHARAEEVDERFPLVMARALAEPERALELVGSLAGEGGKILLFLSVKDALNVQSRFGGRVLRYCLPFSGKGRELWYTVADFARV